MVGKEFKIGVATILFVKGDITEVATDAIVNAANHTLMGGGGVDGAIHRKGGPQILEECKKIRTIDWPEGLPTGKAVITTGGNLKAKHVIHTVGPVWHGGTNREDELLASCYKNSLQLAAAHGIKTIAFPSISTGVYGFPFERAVQIALKILNEFLETDSNFEKVVFVCFSENDYSVFLKHIKA